MISTQRILVMILLMNMITGLSMDLYLNNSSNSYDRLDEIQELGNEQLEGFIQEENAPTTNAIIGQEFTWGNALKMTGRIFVIFIRGIVPIPFQKNHFTTTIESIIASIIATVQMMMYMLVILELYLVFKNKKGT